MSTTFKPRFADDSFATFEKRPLGRTGHTTSFLGFGALEIGRDWGIGSPESCTKPDEDTASRVLNGALDFGINMIDTARAYHESEERIGKSIGSRREEFFLSTKCGEHSGPNGNYYDFSFDGVRRSIDESLKRLGTDRIDILHVHFGPDPETVLAEGGCIRAMQLAKAEGKVRWLAASPRRRGFVGTPLDIMQACIDQGIFDILQVHYNLLEQEAGPLITKAAERGIGILIRSGFAQGALTTRAKTAMADTALFERLAPYLALVGGDFEMLTDLAWAFLQNNPFISSVLVGTKSFEHLAANVARAQRRPDPALLQKLFFDLKKVA